MERNWFRRVLAPRSRAAAAVARPGRRACDPLDGADWAADLAAWQAQCEDSRAAAATRHLDDTGLHHGAPVSLRWIYVHMIEEYARHNGHADLIRESVDGATGVSPAGSPAVARAASSPCRYVQRPRVS